MFVRESVVSEGPGQLVGFVAIVVVPGMSSAETSRSGEKQTTDNSTTTTTTTATTITRDWITNRS